MYKIFAIFFFLVAFGALIWSRWIRGNSDDAGLFLAAIGVALGCTAIGSLVLAVANKREKGESDSN